MISLVCVAFAVKPFPYQVYGVFILLGTVLIALNTLVYMFYFKTDKQRSDLSVYSVYDTIDYSPYNTSADADDKTYSPNVYRAMLIVAVAVAVSAVLHYKDGMFQYSVWCTAGTSLFVISLAVLAVLLKKGVRIVDIKWCVLAIIMITYLLTTLESNFWGKPIQLVLAVVSVIMFVKHNR